MGAALASDGGGCELLIGHRAWLLREDFWRVAVEVRWEAFRGQEVAAV